MFRGRWFLFICPVCKCRPRYNVDGELQNPETILRFFTKQELNKFLSDDFDNGIVCSRECMGIMAVSDPEWWN